MPNLKQEIKALAEMHSPENQEKQRQKALGMICEKHGFRKLKTGYSDKAYEAFKKTHSNI